MKNSILILLGVCFLSGCSYSPQSGMQHDPADPLNLTMMVPHLNATYDELSVEWQAANVDINGNIMNWQQISFITRPNSSAPFSIPVNGETWRVYADSVQIYNWTKANTGYTGGCGGVPNSCPEHALIRAQIQYTNFLLPAAVFPESTGLSCIFAELAAGGLSIMQNCGIPSADGIVVIFSGN